MGCCDIWGKFQAETGLIKEYSYWNVVLYPRQRTLGYCVAITKRHHLSLGDLTTEEMAEYQLVAKEMERALGVAFSFDKIHHLMLMFKDPHTHFHIIPRYEEKRACGGKTFIDKFKPNPLLNDYADPPEEVKTEIIEKIRRGLP